MVAENWVMLSAIVRQASALHWILLKSLVIGMITVSTRLCPVTFFERSVDGCHLPARFFDQLLDVLAGRDLRRLQNRDDLATIGELAVGLNHFEIAGVTAGFFFATFFFSVGLF
jgi:hypothetical protein